MPDHTAQPLTRQERRALATEYALRTWPTLDANQKTGIRFGMFPAEIMRQAEQETGCSSHDLACAFMDAAKANGGMRA
jgi:hypothetical protein